MSADQLALLQLVVDHFDGSIIGTPADIERDGRTVATAAGVDWRDLGWPATGLGLAKLLERSADQLTSAHLLVCHTPEAPGQPEWLAITDTAADLMARDGNAGTTSATAAPPALTEKLTAVLRHLAADDTWTGTLDEVRLAYRALPATLRAGLTGRPWPASTDKLATMLSLATTELARRGVAVERTDSRLSVWLDGNA